MKSHRIFGIRNIAFCLCIVLSSSVIHAQDTWSTASSTGFTARWAAAASEVDGEIYVMGGLGVGAVALNLVEVYDPSTNSWSSPTTNGTFTARRSASSVVADGKIYVLGGSASPSNGSVVYNTLEIFDPLANNWSTPVTTGTFTPRGGFTSAVINGKIYVVGGFVDGGNNLPPVSTVESFDLSSNTWNAVDINGTYTPRHGLCSCVSGGKLYTFGGADETSVLNTVEVFDPVTSVWSTPATTGTFTARRGAGCSVLDGKIYVIGGYTGIIAVPGDYLSTVEVFDPVTNVWTTPSRSGKFTARYGLNATTVNGKIYAMAGQTSQAVQVNTNEVLTPPGSIVNNESAMAFQLSPNPTEGIIRLVGAPENISHVSIMNMLGEKLMDIPNIQVTEFSVDLSKFPSGIYFMQIVTDKSVLWEKIIRK